MKTYLLTSKHIKYEKLFKYTVLQYYHASKLKSNSFFFFLNYITEFLFTC